MDGMDGAPSMPHAKLCPYAARRVMDRLLTILNNPLTRASYKPITAIFTLEKLTFGARNRSAGAGARNGEGWHRATGGENAALPPVRWFLVFK